MQYFILIEGEQHGPLTGEELHRMHIAGQIGDENLVWREGLPEWQPVKELLASLTGKSLPPLPSLPPIPRMQSTLLEVELAPSARKLGALRSASGIIGLLLFILAIFNVGGCINAQHKLQAFTSGSDPDEAPRLFLETAQGISQDDPLRGISGLFERKAALTQDAESAQIGAWLCLIGAAVAEVVFYLSSSSTKSGRKLENIMGIVERNNSDV